MSVGQMNGQQHPPASVARREHRVEVEELVAHLTGQHACAKASDYIQAVQAEAIENKVKIGVAVPGLDGQSRIAVEVDSGALLSDPHHRRILDGLHAEHSHDWPEATTTLARIHRWKDEDAT